MTARPATRISPPVAVSRPPIEVEECGLAAARRAEDDHELAGPDGQVDVGQGRDRQAVKAVDAADVIELDQGGTLGCAGATVAGESTGGYRRTAHTPSASPKLCAPSALRTPRGL